MQASTNNSVQGEHRYWQAWIAAHGKQACLLQPFIYSYSENSVELVDELINKSGSHENDALFALVNIDNGFLQFFYAGWDTPLNQLHYIAFDGTTKAMRSGVLTDKTQFIKELEALSAHDGFVDCQRARVFDESSFYLSIRIGSETTRFAAYAPDISGDDSQTNMEKFVQVLLKTAHPDHAH